MVVVGKMGPLSVTRDTIAEICMTHTTMDEAVLMLGERGLSGHSSAHRAVYSVHLAN